MLTWNSGMAGTRALSHAESCRACSREQVQPTACVSGRMRSLTTLLVLAAVLLVLAPAAGAKTYPPHYEVGIATRSINPGPDGKFDGQPVYLGGYGIGGGSPVFEGRPATGVLRGGVDVRAIVVGDGTHYVALADAQLQGWFAATRDGPYGIIDVRRGVAA